MSDIAEPQDSSPAAPIAPNPEPIETPAPVPNPVPPSPQPGDPNPIEKGTSSAPPVQQEQSVSQQSEPVQSQPPAPVPPSPQPGDPIEKGPPIKPAESSLKPGDPLFFTDDRTGNVNGKVE